MAAVSTQNHESKPLARRIEVLRPGTFKPMSGADVSFSAQDLGDIAGRYDPDLHAAPLVIGHPKTDDPAFAWADAFTIERQGDGERLVASLSDVHPEIDRAVQDGRFRKVSLSLFAPKAPNNPTPGHHYPKHIGLLGAAAPAVSGLKPVTEAAFARDEDVVITLGAPPAANALAALFQNLRDLFIERDGRDAADRVIPEFEVGWLREDGAWAQPTPADGEPAGDSLASPGNEETTDMTGNQQPPAAPPAATTSGAAAAGDGTRDLATREAQLAERERQIRRAENARALDAAINAGRFPPGLKAETLDFMDQLGADETELAFGGGDEKRTPLAQFKRLLDSLPQAVPLGEAAPDGGQAREQDPAFAAPPDAEVDGERLKIHQQALEYQRQNPNADYMTAVQAVGGGRV